MEQTIAICVNTDVMAKMLRTSKWARVAYHDALAQLEPGKRVQYVKFDGEKKVLAGAKELVDIGVLKPVTRSASTFTVPKSVAFAKWEPTLDAILAAER